VIKSDFFFQVMNAQKQNTPLTPYASGIPINKQETQKSATKQMNRSSRLPQASW
jgi:hypothetical protein